MALHDELESGLAKAVRTAGSQVAFGALIGKRQSTIQTWLANGKELPAEYALRVEAALGIPRYELRADIYPPEEHLPVPTAQHPAAHPSAPATQAPQPISGADGTPPAHGNPSGADPLAGVAA